jgi:hypothetical protein
MSLLQPNGTRCDTLTGTAARPADVICGVVAALAVVERQLWKEIRRLGQAGLHQLQVPLGGCKLSGYPQIDPGGMLQEPVVRRVIVRRLIRREPLEIECQAHMARAVHLMRHVFRWGSDVTGAANFSALPGHLQRGPCPC